MPNGPVAFVGLGMMGLPMASRLVAAGHRVHGADLSETARAAFVAAGGAAFSDAAEACRGVRTVITMLPDGEAVRAVLLQGGAVAALAADALVIDMSSSAPLETRALGEELAALGVAFIDAPVSGGVRKAKDGTLSIMTGGDEAATDRAMPLLRWMGAKVIRTGALGSGHAVKALNNFVSAAGLVAACEAVLVAEKFGVDPAVLVDVLNASTGKNNSTELKMKPFVLSERYDSGFALSLMAKDLRTAADLAHGVAAGVSGPEAQASLWTAANDALGRGADHTAIHKHLASGRKD